MILEPFVNPIIPYFFLHLQTPEAFEEFGNNTEPDPSTPLHNSTFSLPVEPLSPHTCIDVDGLNQTCEFDLPPAPTLDNGVCTNMVVKVSDRSVM